MSAELLIASVREMKAMHQDVITRPERAHDTGDVTKPIRLAFEASVKHFLKLGPIDEQLLFLSEVKKLTALDGQLHPKHFVNELICIYTTWLKEGRHHDSYLKYGWTYFGVAITKIFIKPT
jgi:hypothetical protein